MSTTILGEYLRARGMNSSATNMNVYLKGNDVFPLEASLPFMMKGYDDVVPTFFSQGCKTHTSDRTTYAILCLHKIFLRPLRIALTEDNPYICFHYTRPFIRRPPDQLHR